VCAESTTQRLANRHAHIARPSYCFFALLVEYLGGERSLLILAHGRPPTKHPFPFNFVLRPMDVR